MNAYKRGLQVGVETVDDNPGKGSTSLTFGIIAILGFVTYGLSPGARYFYKHHKLPPA